MMTPLSLTPRFIEVLKWTAGAYNCFNSFSADLVNR